MATVVSGSSGSFAAAFAKAGNAAAQSQFEFRFNQLQNTVIRRVNSEIHKIQNDPGDRVRQWELERDLNKMTEKLPVLNEFIWDNQVNNNRLVKISEDLPSAMAAFTDEDDDTNLSAAELATLEEKKADIQDKIKLLQDVNFEDRLVDNNIILQIQKLGKTLEGLTPVEGTVDAEGSGSPTNDNRAIYDLLEKLTNTMASGLSIGTTTLRVALDLKMSMEANVADLQAENLQTQLVNRQKQVDEVQALKDKYANFLKAISVSYEVQGGLAQQIGDAANGFQAPKGSILNLFS